MKKILYMLLLCTLTISTYAQNYEHIVNYNFNGTPVNGVKIKTNIPFSHGLGMPTIKIEGFNYNLPGIAGVARSSMLNLILGWYVYNNIFETTAISSAGGSAPNVWLSNENGKIVIFIDQRIYYQRFTISAFAQGKSETPEYFQGWTVVDEPRGGTSQTQMVYKNVSGGNVGIGTESPQHPLDINGATQIFNTANAGHLILSADDNYSLDKTQIGIDFKIANRNQVIGRIASFYNNSANGGYGGLRFHYKNAGVLNEAMRIASNGYVGIGTENPDQKLTVKGKIHAQEVLIDLNGPLADYVLKPDYKLMPLNELEQFVQTNSHLPEIPSAEEVAEKGLSIGEMQNKLLQKIEELTLYIIDQNKEIQALKEENKEIKEQLNK